MNTILNNVGNATTCTKIFNFLWYKFYYFDFRYFMILKKNPFLYPNVVCLVLFTSRQFLSLSLPASSSHDKTIRVVVVLHQLLQHSKCLHRELPGGGDYDAASSCNTLLYCTLHYVNDSLFLGAAPTWERSGALESLRTKEKRQVMKATVLAESSVSLSFWNISVLHGSLRASNLHSYTLYTIYLVLSPFHYIYFIVIKEKTWQVD